MADNYLEHRMDDYRSGRLTPRHTAAHAATATAAFGASSLALTPCRVFIDSGLDAGSVLALVRSFRDAGCRVAFTLADDEGRGNAVAQQTGARFYPARLAARAITDYGAFEVSIAGGDALTISVCRGGRSAVNRIMPSTDTDIADVADVALLLASDRGVLLDNLEIKL